MRRPPARPRRGDPAAAAPRRGDDHPASPPSIPSLSPIPSPVLTPGRSVGTSDERRGAGVGAFLLAIVTAGALAHVAVRLKGLEVAYALGRERHVATQLEEERRRLQIEIGMLKDPGRVVAIARDKLKMGPPSADAIRAVGSGRLLSEVGPAAPASERAGKGKAR
jgi:cell division protein FtsL